MAKKVLGYIKLQVPAGKANPSPPIGPALGQRGLNIMEFCKAFNAQTQGVEPGLPLPVVITAYADKSFTFIIKTPPATVLIKKAVKLEKGMPIPVVITAYGDRTFTFITKTPPNTYFLKKAAGIESGAKTVGTQIVGKVTKKQIEEIAKAKQRDLTGADLEAAVRTVAGTARSMGITVEGIA